MMKKEIVIAWYLRESWDIFTRNEECIEKSKYQR